MKNNTFMRLTSAFIALFMGGCSITGSGSSDINNSSDEQISADTTSDGKTVSTGELPFTNTLIPYPTQTGGPVFTQAEYAPAEKEELGDVAVSGEFEDGVFSGKLSIASDISGFTGSGYVKDFDTVDDIAAVEVEIPQGGRYDLVFTVMSPDKSSTDNARVDKRLVGKITVPQSEGWVEVKVSNVELQAGTREIGINHFDGGIYLDKVTVVPAEGVPSETYDVSAKLSNPNADDGAKRLMKFLADNYGKNVITGLTAGSSTSSSELRTVYKVTGKYPAIVAFDMMEYSPSRKERGSSSMDIENAVYWHNTEGGIVTFAWHWNAPTAYLYDQGQEDVTAPWWKGFYKEGTNIDLAKIMNGEDDEGLDLLISDIDAIAGYLKILQNEGVPVLWRPLHEASGGWFWWGASGPEPFIKLWQLMYDRLTNYHGLNNLIWVYNGQDGAWYPGDEYVDIIGEDIYPRELDTSPQTERFNLARSYTDTKKIIALTECGVVPDIDKMLEDGVMWSWFAPWEGEFTLDGAGLATSKTPEEIWIKAFNHKNTITLDELPDLDTYPLD